jgi:anti-sigma factor RsiW
MTASNDQDERDLRLNAYLDGELDAVASRRFEEQLAVEPDLAVDLGKLRSLRAMLRADIADDLPSEALRRRIARQVAPPQGRRFVQWRAMAASLIVGIAVGGGATLGILRSDETGATADEVIGGHVRALMASQPIDVVSSDQHTVKPWFDGKIAFAPTVVDLTAAGFPLVGGRIDVVDLQPAPALVYRANKHLISLVEIPGGGPVHAVERKDSRGFEALTWSDGSVTYWAVSDASDDELQAFVKALEAAPKP